MNFGRFLGQNWFRIFQDLHWNENLWIENFSLTIFFWYVVVVLTNPMKNDRVQKIFGRENYFGRIRFRMFRNVFYKENLEIKNFPWIFLVSIVSGQKTVKNGRFQIFLVNSHWLGLIQNPSKGISKHIALTRKFSSFAFFSGTKIFLEPKRQTIGTVQIFWSNIHLVEIDSECFKTYFQVKNSKLKSFLAHFSET